MGEETGAGPEEKPLGSLMTEHSLEARAEGAAWDKVWTLSLAVGNGFGLVTLGSTLKEAKGLMWLAVLPSMWLFALGLLVAGAAPFVQARLHVARADVWVNVRQVYEEEAGNLVLFKSDVKQVRAASSRMGFWRRAAMAMPLIAAVAFGAAVLWVLGSITFVRG